MRIKTFGYSACMVLAIGIALFIILPARSAVGAALPVGERSIVGSLEAPGSGSGYELSWRTIDGGGAMNLSGGSYTLNGTIGQPDAGKMSGGSFVHIGGFWVDLGGYSIYLPVIVR